MAKIEYTAFVEDWTQNNPQHPDWAMKTAEPHRKKDGDQWVTTARTFRTVKAGYENDQPVRIDFTQFAKGQRVTVVGTELTEVRESNGKKYYDVVVKATSVRVVEQQGRPQQHQQSSPAPQQQATQTQDAWSAGGSYTDETPF